jgi:hypothetical protein
MILKPDYYIKEKEKEQWERNHTHNWLLMNAMIH